MSSGVFVRFRFMPAGDLRLCWVVAKSDEEERVCTVCDSICEGFMYESGEMRLGSMTRVVVAGDV